MCTPCKAGTTQRLVDAEDKARYAKEVEEWSKQHPDDALVLDDNGIAVKQSKWKESKEEEAKKKEQKRIKRAAKERK